MPPTPSNTSPPQIDNLRGVLWMLAASVTTATSSVGVKYIAHLPLLQVGFMRAVTALIVLMPFLMRHGWGVFRTSRLDLHLQRILFSSGSMILSIYAIAHMQLAMATSLSFTRPLFMIIIAYFLLKERVGWRRGLATGAGFCGVLVIMGPTHADSLPAVTAALIAAACAASTYAVVRRQSAYDSPATIMCWVTAGICFILTFPAYFVWEPPRPSDWLVTAGLGVTGAVAQYMIIRAFTYGEATVVNPVDYTQIIVTTIAAYFLFGEVPAMWTIVGIGIIVASTLYIMLREARQKTAAPSAPDP
jgi:drug/metabolite transporter (DMT)-like permease